MGKNSTIQITTRFRIRAHVTATDELQLEDPFPINLAQMFIWRKSRSLTLQVILLSLKDFRRRFGLFVLYGLWKFRPIHGRHFDYDQYRPKGLKQAKMIPEEKSSAEMFRFLLDCTPCLVNNSSARLRILYGRRTSHIPFGHKHSAETGIGKELERI